MTIDNFAEIAIGFLIAFALAMAWLGRDGNYKHRNRP